MSSIFNKKRFNSLMRMFDDPSQRDIAFQKANAMLADHNLRWIDIIDSISSEETVTHTEIEIKSEKKERKNFFSFKETIFNKNSTKTNKQEDIIVTNNIINVKILESKIYPITRFNNALVCKLKNNNTHEIFNDVYFFDPNDVLFIERHIENIYNINVQLKHPTKIGESIVAKIIRD